MLVSPTPPSSASKSTSSSRRESKLFCRCSTKFGAPAQHADLPRLHRHAGLAAGDESPGVRARRCKTAIALNCKIAEFTKWDRKQYYYPDLPKGYQISQFDLPMSADGYLEISDPKDQASSRSASASSALISKKTPARAFTTKPPARPTAKSI